MSITLARLLHRSLSRNLRTNLWSLNLGLNTIPAAMFCCERIDMRQSSSSADQIKSDEVITSKNMRRLLKAYVGGARYFFEEATSDASSQSLREVTSQDELETRSMKDSIREAVVPLGDNPSVRDKYLTFYKTVRIGKLLEDMDTLAGLVGYKYYKGPAEYEDRAPFALVTASVDKFKLKESFIRSDRNIRMTGFVSYAGKTSLEITIHLGMTDLNSLVLLSSDSPFF